MSEPAPSQRLGSYELIALIGKGGMGEVWRAHDTRLNRDVAIKFCSQQFSERFEREARAIAALNHPNICTLYDVGPINSGPDSPGVSGGQDAESPRFWLVMEFIEGATLADRIKEGPIPLEEALRIARHVADALDAAHEKNIIHRDLKPGNIKIKPDGTVKVLDFGLAKMGGTPTAAAKAEDSPTLTLAATQMGMILGTAAYMSPEQARGKEVDKRADIWAFGVVLWEMVTGKPLFQGDDVTDTLAAVLRHEPDWNRVPMQVRRLLNRCLTKDPKKRLRDIGDAWELLDGIADTPQQMPSSQFRTTMVAWAVTGVVTVLALVVSFVHFHEKPPEVRLVRTFIPPPEKTVFNISGGLGATSPPAISPDGRLLVFSAVDQDGRTHLWIRPLDALTAQALSGTESATHPFWSPDSRFIAFFADGKLKKLPASGGTPVTLCDAPAPRGGSWSPEGVIIFAFDANTLHRVSASGGMSTLVPTVDRVVGELRARWPWFLPDGRHFLYYAVKAGAPATKDYIRVGSLSPGEDKTLVEAPFSSLSGPTFAQGYLLFLSDTTLMAQPFDSKRLALTGEAVPIAENVLSNGNLRRGVFSSSDNGFLLYLSGGRSLNDLVWLDRSGKRIATLGDPGAFGRLHFSPDRKTVAISMVDRSTQNRDIWLYDVGRGLRTRFTFDPGREDDPIWSPDGTEIIFGSDRKGKLDLYRKPFSGSGSEELLYSDPTVKFPQSVSPNGEFLLYGTMPPNTIAAAHLMVLPLSNKGSNHAPTPLSPTQGQFSEVDAQFSPDGNWVAYTSNESGEYEVFVVPFSGTGGPVAGKRQISTAGGAQPRWRKDGKELFYVGRGGKLNAVDLSIQGTTLDIRSSHELFGPLLTGNSFQYDVSADGQRFLAVLAPEQKANESLTLVQNWPAGLKK